MEIIPAIDIVDGKAVRLTMGDFSKKVIYHEDPLEAALAFEGAGLKRLHLVDLDGAMEGVVKNWRVLERIAKNTQLRIDFSGGISTHQAVETALNTGASFISIGSIAVKDEKLLTQWLVEFGTGKFIIGADVKQENIVIRGWTETTPFSVFELIEKYKLRGVKNFFCTDIGKDGLLQGPSIDLYKKILNAHPSIDLIASGGISSFSDLEILREAGCHGAIIGKAIYENKISLAELKLFSR